MNNIRANHSHSLSDYPAKDSPKAHLRHMAAPIRAYPRPLSLTLIDFFSLTAHSQSGAAQNAPEFAEIWLNERIETQNHP